MRTARFCSCRGRTVYQGVYSTPPDTQSPDTLPLKPYPHPHTILPLDTSSPLERTWDQGPGKDMVPEISDPLNRLTDARENITFPQLLLRAVKQNCSQNLHLNQTYALDLL